MAQGQDHHGLLRCGPTQKGVEKFHGVGRVCQHRKPGTVQCRNQETRGDPHAFGHVVVLVARAVVKGAPALGEDHDQPGRDVEMGLGDAGAHGLERFQPFVAGTAPSTYKVIAASWLSLWLLLALSTASADAS